MLSGNLGLWVFTVWKRKKTLNIRGGVSDVSMLTASRGTGSELAGSGENSLVCLCPPPPLALLLGLLCLMSQDVLPGPVGL
jgi:hypothetical protein